jgi:Fe-S cluster biosynthesis and repair protein YggX
MAITCGRCGREAEPPPRQRIGFPGPVKDRILQSICAECWKEWEGVEVKVINEYRLSFLDPQHREMLQKACFDFLKLPEQA